MVMLDIKLIITYYHSFFCNSLNINIMTTSSSRISSSRSVTQSELINLMTRIMLCY